MRGISDVVLTADEIAVDIHAEDEESVSPSSVAANDRDHIDALRRLEEEYCHLNSMERNINSSLCRLQEEEASL